jgi:4-hydroxy-tetrahydrodipicolinate reductase
MSLKVLVIGDGKMGRAVAQLATERGCEVTEVCGPAEMARGISAGCADVAVEFTEPRSAAANVRACLAAGIPVVTGTTGWDDLLAVVRDEAVKQNGTMLHSPNFSVGVAMFKRLVELATRLAGGGSPQSFAAHLIETHHSAKVDAPSGTARMLAKLARDAMGRELPTTSVRVGSVPGRHELVLDAPFEQIRLVHDARDRRVFADGAVSAAQWLAGRKGVFTFDDFLKEQFRGS